jgi:hypothetical protein
MKPALKTFPTLTGFLRNSIIKARWNTESKCWLNLLQPLVPKAPIERPCVTGYAFLVNEHKWLMAGAIKTLIRKVIYTDYEAKSK